MRDLKTSCPTCGYRRPDFLTDHELGTLAEALLQGSGEPLTTEEIGDFLRHAQEAITHYALILLVLEGEVVPRRDPDQAHDYIWKKREKTGATS